MFTRPAEIWSEVIYEGLVSLRREEVSRGPGHLCTASGVDLAGNRLGT